ncbi:MAG TPA: glycosyltransferase family 9 protein, partial [Negativicutes bacterium]|nr:glycosyltransferase family 9 protein [Negativicutes bacterium]
AALHLCAKSFSHGWTETAFFLLATRLQEALPNIGWIVTAGPAEEPYLDSYRNSLSVAGIPAVTGLNLSGMAAILSQLQLLISWDTGVVHLASAVGTPILDIFPNKDFDYCIQRWGPWEKQGIALSQATKTLDSAQITVIVSAAIRILDRSVSEN